MIFRSDRKRRPNSAVLWTKVMSDITFSLCLMPLQDHRIKGPRDLVDESLSTKVTTVTSLMLIDLVKVEIERFYFVT